MVKVRGGAGGFSGDIQASSLYFSNEKAAVDYFYEKLGKLNESSGLSLLFNFRRTMFDLYLFYKEVIKRGGFYQVTKNGKWDDVASVPNLKNCASISAAQLKNVYQMLILEYELMYSRTMPDQANIWPAKDFLSSNFGSGVNPSFSSGKRKHCEISSRFSNGNEVKMVNKENSSTIISQNSKAKEVISGNNPKPPQKARNGYQIFLRLEIQRLKMVLGEKSSSRNLRKTATAMWRSLPEKDRLPYLEASMMDKERYEKEMAAYNYDNKELHENQINSSNKSQTLFSTTTPIMLDFSEPKEHDEVYHVSLDDTENLDLPPDESAMQMAFQAMKKAKTNDSIFQIDWENGCPDIYTS